MRSIDKADGFARVFPEHKYAIVKALQAEGHIVAMTGDGVNDAPALKQADCGTAVSGATDAARGAAALILTAPGLSVINSAIDEARRIFGRITTYTIYRVALTMDIMFLVVLSTVFLGFQPLTAVMIVIMSLLDDIPIMTIAYDNTPVSRAADPLADAAHARRLRRARLLLDRAVLRAAADRHGGAVRPALGQALGLTDRGHLQTVMFLQLVAGGHLLLFVTRSERWFFRPPYPAAPLFGAIVATQVLAVLMCGFGWLVPAISWTADRLGLGLQHRLDVRARRGAARAERLIDHRTAARQRSARCRHPAAARRPRRRRGGLSNREGDAVDFRKKLIVEPGSKVRLKDIDPGYHGKHESEDEAADDLTKNVARLDRAAGAALRRAQACAPDRAAGHRRRRQGRHLLARDDGDEPAGHHRDRLQAADRGGARARLPLARASARAGAAARWRSSTARTTRTCWWCGCTSWCRRRSGRSATT